MEKILKIHLIAGMYAAVMQCIININAITIDIYPNHPLWVVVSSFVCTFFLMRSITKPMLKRLEERKV
ncbi:hypothetical protein [Vibrio phage RYC]|nr:hypothetical protein [Vibrio phage RYC]